MREKRQHPRATLTTSVDIYRLLPGSNPAPASAAPTYVEDESSHVAIESRDISHGGMFLAGPAPCPVGTELLLVFDLPGMGKARIPGFVRWHRADGFGVQFGLLGARETHAIGRLIRSQSVPDVD